MKTSKNFSLLEIGGDAESPMIGTILDVENNETGLKRFNQLLKTALGEHFDSLSEDIEILPFPFYEGMFNVEPYTDIVVKIEGTHYSIEVVETWVYTN